MSVSALSSPRAIFTEIQERIKKEIAATARTLCAVDEMRLYLGEDAQFIQPPQSAIQSWAEQWRPQMGPRLKLAPHSPKLSHILGFPGAPVGT